MRKLYIISKKQRGVGGSLEVDDNDDFRALKTSSSIFDDGIKSLKNRFFEHDVKAAEF
jgi:hypothetical protein